MGRKEAFCLLLWQHQGGEVNASNIPIRTPEARTSGMCDEPYDCYRCPLMQQEIAQHLPGHTNWVCPGCLKDVVQVAKHKNIEMYLTGHYSEGQCQFIGCTRPARIELGDDGEARQFPCNYSRFLQLVIGDINQKG